jgi:hypothetical protein
VDINANKIRLEFDGFGLHFDRDYGWSKVTGWSLIRDGSFVLSFKTWEEVWAAMTTKERVRCIVFANQIR